METKFKVGDIVYDSVNYPNVKGEITAVCNGEYNYPLTAKFSKEVECYTMDGRLTLSNIPTLSFTPYELKGFTQERPWTPKDGEWIAVKDYYSDDFFKITTFLKMDDSKFMDKNLNNWHIAKPLTDFINER